MSDDAKKSLNNLMELMNCIQYIKMLSDEAGKLYSSALVFNVEKIEQTLVDSFVHGSKILDTMDADQRNSLFDKAAVPGCIVRFKRDLEASTKIANEVKEKHAKIMNTTGPLS